MKKNRIWPYFSISFFLTLFIPAPLLFFSPFFAILYRKASFIKSLWIGALCGLILDLLGTSPFGIHALIGGIVTTLLFRYHIYFIDKPIGLAFYTTLISLVTTILNRLSLYTYSPKLPWTFSGSITDFLIMPLIDGCISIVCFSFPFILYHFLKKQFLFLRKRSKQEKEDPAHAK